MTGISKQCATHRMMGAIVLCLVFCQVAWCDFSGGTWSTAAPLPTPGALGATGRIGDEVYSVGMVGDGTYFNTAYSLSADSWSALPAMNLPRRSSAGGVVDGKVYALGDYINPPEQIRTECEMYDPVSGAWTSVASMLSPRVDAGSAVFDDMIYTFGGKYGLPGPWKSDKNERYSPATNTWEVMAPMPAALQNPSVAVVNNVIYVIGGHSLPTDTNSDAVYAYDPVSDTWRQKARRAYAVGGSTAVVRDGLIYLFGGSLIGGSVASAVEVYDPALDQWSFLDDMPSARTNSMGFLDDLGRIHLIGGWDGANYLDCHDVFAPVAVPEPASMTLGLLGFSVAGLLSRRGRRRRV